MLAYYASFEPDHKHGGFVATFPDLAHGATQGETLEEATDMAGDSLRSIVGELMKRGEDLPRATKHRGRKYCLVALPALQWAKADLMCGRLNWRAGWESLRKM